MKTKNKKHIYGAMRKLNVRPNKMKTRKIDNSPGKQMQTTLQGKEQITHTERTHDEAI